MALSSPPLLIGSYRSSTFHEVNGRNFLLIRDLLLDYLTEFLFLVDDDAGGRPSSLPASQRMFLYLACPQIMIASHSWRCYHHQSLNHVPFIRNPHPILTAFINHGPSGLGGGIFHAISIVDPGSTAVAVVSTGNGTARYWVPPPVKRYPFASDP
jgi:hypothetical protein